jgi:hypothetical protein
MQQVTERLLQLTKALHISSHLLPTLPLHSGVFNHTSPNDFRFYHGVTCTVSLAKNP